MSYQVELQAAINAAKKAGAMLRDEFYSDGGPRGAGEKATIDEEVEAFLRHTLTKEFPLYGFRAEESPQSNTTPRDEAMHYWLVDPNDGTSAFHLGWRGASVSIALIRNDTPILGVIYAYAAPDNYGDLFSWAEGCGPLQRNGVAQDPVQWPTKLLSRHTILVSHYADSRPEANAAACDPARYMPIPGIAYRLALCAAGEGVAAVGLSKPRDFDYAAGHALLRASQAVVLDERAQPVEYSPAQTNSVTKCFAGPLHLAQALASRDWSKALLAPQKEALNFDLITPNINRLCRETDRLSRAQGCLLGQVIGDSMGSLVEFQSADKIKARYPDGVRDLADGGTWNTLAGQPTDDSEMALMLARAIVQAGRFDEETICRAYVHWFGSHPFDIGSTTAMALRGAQKALSQQQPASDGARQSANPQSQANGAMMRQSPLGVFCHAISPHQAFLLAKQDALLTHPNPLCQELSGIYVATISRAISTQASPAQLFAFAQELAATEKVSPEAQETLHAAKTHVPPDFLSQMGWVKIAFQNAFYQLQHTSSLEEALTATISSGGDTDTNAAICGALWGAAHGRQRIPKTWQDRVLTCRPLPHVRIGQPRPSSFWSVDLLFLAEQLLALSK
jgi:ADP-ribosyl-[dinitrogen reductase] hydrolase